MSLLTLKQLKRIKARAAAATPGPWHFSKSENHVLIDHSGYRFGTSDDGENGEFIAHARTDIPALIAHINELQRRLDLTIL